MKTSEMPQLKPFICNAISGIYFLFMDEDLAYIGQSIDIHFRIRTHINERRILFNSIFYIEVENNNLSEIESHFIIKYNPPYNRTHIFKRELKRIREDINNKKADSLYNDMSSNIIKIDNNEIIETTKKIVNTRNDGTVLFSFFLTNKEYNKISEFIPDFSLRNIFAREAFNHLIKKYKRRKKKTISQEA